MNTRLWSSGPHLKDVGDEQRGLWYGGFSAGVTCSSLCVRKMKPVAMWEMNLALASAGYTIVWKR